MEEPINVEEPADVEEPSNVEEQTNLEEHVQVPQPAQVPQPPQQPVLRRGVRTRRPSQRILLNQWKKPYQFDEDGTGSTPENAFDISNE